MEKLKEWLRYDPHTGDFTWIKNPATGRRMLGKKAGYSDTKGYLRVKIQGKSYSLHRAAFMFMGEEVPEEADHKNRIKDDNRWDNLRASSSTTNAYNKNFKAGATGVLGVNQKGDKFQVRICVGGERKYLGLYEDLELAELVAQEARAHYHKEFACA